MKCRFADCALDTGARRIVRHGREVHLSPKAFELLVVLVERRGQALPKAELLERVWPKVFVSDASLARVVTELRDAIGDDAREIIRTVHGYGYAFEADVSEEQTTRTQAGARCLLLSSEKTFTLSDGEHVAGRDRDLAIWLDSPKVSRRHARIVVSRRGATIEDLGSKNGTYVRGTRIAGPAVLASGDAIRIGPFTLTFRTARGPMSTETETGSLARDE
jgi:DNA-binding winged helix-turn-helix (wHTH) protein